MTHRDTEGESLWHTWTDLTPLGNLIKMFPAPKDKSLLFTLQITKCLLLSV